MFGTEDCIRLRESSRLSHEERTGLFEEEWMSTDELNQTDRFESRRDASTILAAIRANDRLGFESIKVFLEGKHSRARVEGNFKGENTGIADHARTGIFVLSEQFM